MQHCPAHCREVAVCPHQNPGLNRGLTLKAHGDCILALLHICDQVPIFHRAAGQCLKQ